MLLYWPLLHYSITPYKDLDTLVLEMYIQTGVDHGGPHTVMTKGPHTVMIRHSHTVIIRDPHTVMTRGLHNHVAYLTVRAL